MSYRKTAERTGLSAAAMIAALCLLLPGFAFTASAEEGAWTDKAGEQVASGLAATLDADAYYSEKLDPTRLQATISPRPGAGRAELAFLRDKKKTPNAEGGVRGLYFGFERNESTTEMSVSVVLRDGARKCLEGYAVGESVSLDVRTTEGGAVIVYADGRRLIDDFNDITDGVTVTAYSAASVTYAAVACENGGSIEIESLTAGGDTISVGDEWIFADEAKAYTLPAELSAPARLTAGQYSQSLSAEFSAEKKVSVTFTKSGTFRREDGAQGLKVTLDPASGKYAASAEYLKSKSEIGLFQRYETDVTAGEAIEIRLRARLDGGFALELGGTRVLIAGKDPLRLFAAEDFSDGLGKTFLAFESEGGVKVTSIVGGEYDDEPIGREVDALNQSEIGNTAEEWSGAHVDEKGVAYIAGKSALKRELAVDYVGFTMDITNLVSTSVADCSISFSVAASDAPENGGTGAAGANGLVFSVKNKSGVFNLAAYERYGNEVKTIIGDTPLMDVNVYASLRFELVWYDYELRLFINDAEFVNEYGINPLASHYPKYYRNENKKTYLCFGQSLSADDKPLLTPENATRFCVYDIDNILPEKYRVSTNPATENETPEKGLNAAGLWIAAGSTTAAGIAAVTIVYICVRRRHARGKKEEK